MVLPQQHRAGVAWIHPQGGVGPTQVNADQALRVDLRPWAPPPTREVAGHSHVTGSCGSPAPGRPDGSSESPAQGALGGPLHAPKRFPHRNGPEAAGGELTGSCHLRTARPPPLTIAFGGVIRPWGGAATSPVSPSRTRRLRPSAIPAVLPDRGCVFLARTPPSREFPEKHISMVATKVTNSSGEARTYIRNGHAR